MRERKKSKQNLWNQYANAIRVIAHLFKNSQLLNRYILSEIVNTLVNYNLYLLQKGLLLNQEDYNTLELLGMGEE